MKKAKKVKKPLTVFKQKKGWTTATYSKRRSNKGQSRAVYMKSMKNGITKKLCKDTYNSDGSFKHRKDKPV